ncbi:MAG: choice-of-anchor Q domain-containing protein [Verrucomicrobiota bacterium]|jgi:hypothetical protein
MKRSLLQSAAICSLAFTLNLSATVHYVDLNCTNPVSPYTDWSTAATDIQSAIDISINSDHILVTNGVYQTGGRTVNGYILTNRVVVNKAITVQSVNGPAATIIQGYQDASTIDGDDAVRCVYLTNNATLIGFTLTNGATLIDPGDDSDNTIFSGGGVLCESTSAIISNCVITGCSATLAGGGAEGGTVNDCVLTGNQNSGADQCTLSNCTLTGNSSGWAGGGATISTLINCTLATNSALYGGGVFSCTLIGCTLQGNFSDDGGGAFGNNDNPCELDNCTLTGNSASYGGGAEGSTLNNCTLVANGASYGGGADESDLSNCLIVSNSVNATGAGAFDSTLTNCTVWGNTASDGTGGIEGCDAHNCIIFDNNWGDCTWCSLDYCCTDDPLLIDPLGGDFHLQSNSPCVNQGNNADVASTTDLDGNSRIFDGNVDVGAYEFQTPVPLQAVIHTDSTNAIFGYPLNLTGSTLGGVGTTNSWDFGDGTGASNQWSVAHTWTTAGDYPVTLTVFNDANPGGVNTTIIIHVLTQILYFVDANGTNPVAPYSSWAAAATNIQDAVDAAALGGTVIVSNGVYQTGGRVVWGILTNRVAVTKPITVRSVNGPEVTTIQGYQVPGPLNDDAAIRCVYMTNGAMLTGFTLTNGATRLNLYEWSDYGVFCGGGVFCESAGATVSNCVIVGCTSSDTGGGVVGGTLFNCVLSSNSTSDWGGGARSATLINCDLFGNSAVGGGGAWLSLLSNCLLRGNSAVEDPGGGAVNSTLNNCTLVENSSDYVGGGAAYSTLNNCLLQFNSCPDGPNYKECELNYCCTTPLPDSGLGNITNEPAFVNLAGGDLHLQGNSPCINAGNNTYVSVTNDLDGNPRIMGIVVDIGAYEFQNPASVLSYAWAQQYGLPTDGSVDYLDSDGDGLNNWQEWKTGTNPTNALSVLKMASAMATNNPPGLIVAWQSVIGITYFLQSSSNLGAQPAFSTIQSNIVGQAGITSYMDTTATNSGPYFYRVGVQ